MFQEPATIYCQFTWITHPHTLYTLQPFNGPGCLIFIVTHTASIQWSAKWFGPSIGCANWFTFQTDGAIHVRISIWLSVCVWAWLCERVLIEFWHVSQTTSNSIGKLINLISKEWKRQETNHFTQIKYARASLLSSSGRIVWFWFGSSVHKKK